MFKKWILNNKVKDKGRRMTQRIVEFQSKLKDILTINSFIFIKGQYVPVKRRIHIKENPFETTFASKDRNSFQNC